MPPRAPSHPASPARSGRGGSNASGYRRAAAATGRRAARAAGGRAERKDAGEGDIQERQDAERRGLDDMPPEAVKIARPRAAGIDKGGRAALLRDQGRVDPERGAAPIDMRVQIDKPRRDDQTAH